MIFEFDRETAISALLYIAQRVKEPSYHPVVKVMYFADLCHLERYGRMIFGGDYRAYEYGPVPHQVYGMLMAAERKPNKISNEAPFQITRHGNRKMINALADPDLDRLSESELECLDEAIANWGNEDFGVRTQASHGPVWQKAWDTKRNSPMPLEDIVMTLDGGAQLLEHLQNPHSWR